MAELTVRAARPEDMLAIEQLRDAYYTVRNEPIQIRNEAVWTVAVYKGRVVACRATCDTARLERWQMDLYADASRAGRLGVSAIMAAAHAEADRDGINLIGVVASDNKPVLEAALARGWEQVGIMIHRRPGGKQCPE